MPIKRDRSNLRNAKESRNVWFELRYVLRIIRIAYLVGKPPIDPN